MNFDTNTKRNKRWLLTTALTIVAAVSYVSLDAHNGPASAIAAEAQSNDHGNGHGNGHDNGGGNSDPADQVKTETPIKHVIILIGENRGLDHTFGIYKPKGRGETISNLLSKGIVKEDGTPGPNFNLAQQFSVAQQSAYYIGAPDSAKTPYSAGSLMPQPNTAGTPSAQSDTGAPFKSVAEASIETDISSDDTVLLTTGASGLPNNVLDTRIPNAGKIANGLFPLQGPNIDDDDYTGDTTHRYFTAFQQQDCSMANATKDNPTGCLNDLFPFVMDTYSATNKSEGNSMGFYNAVKGQASVLKKLADRFTLSDNFHQSVLGGTGANHFLLGTGDAGFWSDGKGHATVPPSSIANPNPKAGTVNQYTVDGNFTACGDTSQPGIQPIVSYLKALPYKVNVNCQPGHYYMVNNVNPGYLPNGALSGGTNLPPSPVRTIGDALMEKHISWAYYGGAYNDAVALSNAAVAANPTNPDLTAAALADPAHALGVAYCQICNPFQYATSIMADPKTRAEHVKDTADLLTAIKNNTLPSVSFGKPDGLLDGHPQSSKVDLFEAYVQNILAALDANPRLKAETAVLVTFDEAGGYYDSGFVQPIDFFGDGPRIPLLVVSPYSTGGKIDHSYADHASVLKFIERNWKLEPLTNRSRDNLPNPKARKDNAYVPTNMPAIADLFDAFDFHGRPSNLTYAN
jgi:phospholipase C